MSEPDSPPHLAPVSRKEPLLTHLQATFDIDRVAADEIADAAQAIGLSMSDLTDFYSSEYILQTEELRSQLDTYQALDRLSKLLKPKPIIPTHIQILWSTFHATDESTGHLKNLIRIHHIDHDFERLLTKTLELIHEYYVSFDEPEKVPTGRNLYEALIPSKHHAEAMGLLCHLSPG